MTKNKSHPFITFLSFVFGMRAFYLMNNESCINNDFNTNHFRISDNFFINHLPPLELNLCGYTSIWHKKKDGIYFY